MILPLIPIYRLGRLTISGRSLFFLCPNEGETHFGESAIPRRDDTKVVLLLDRTPIGLQKEICRWQTYWVSIVPIIWVSELLSGCYYRRFGN